MQIANDTEKSVVRNVYQNIIYNNYVIFYKSWRMGAKKLAKYPPPPRYIAVARQRLRPWLGRHCGRGVGIFCKIWYSIPKKECPYQILSCNLLSWEWICNGHSAN